MIVAAGRDLRNRTTMIDAVRVGVDALVQLRRNTQGQCPGKCRENAGRDKDASVIYRTREPAHRAAIL